MSAPANSARRWYFACERELWTGNGEDTPLEMVASSFSVHQTRHAAERTANQWAKRGWTVCVTGPHAMESSAYDEEVTQ